MKAFLNLSALVILFIFLSVWFVGIAFGTEIPQKLSTDARIEVVPFVANQVVPVRGSSLITTQITFGKKEFIQNVQNGDLGAWTASISPTLPNMLFIKPTVQHSNTNLTVVTNKHTYYFHLVAEAGSENAEDAENTAEKVTYAVHFIYPAEERAHVLKQIANMEQQKEAELSAFQNPQNFQWDYSFSGDPSIVPVHVFDDGKFTYFQLQPNQAVPAVFAVTDASGDESVVNYRQDGQYLVIQRIAPQFTLRAGAQSVASIFNNHFINELEGSVPYGSAVH